MVKILLILLLLTPVAYADRTVTPVWEWPCQDRISFSTVTSNSAELNDATGVVTVGTVRGRKEIVIVNMSDTTEVYLCNVTDPTVIMTYGFPLFPRQTVSARIASDLYLWVTSNSVVNLRIWELK